MLGLREVIDRFSTLCAGRPGCYGRTCIQWNAAHLVLLCRLHKHQQCLFQLEDGSFVSMDGEGLCKFRGDSLSIMRIHSLRFTICSNLRKCEYRGRHVFLLWISYNLRKIELLAAHYSGNS